MLKTKQSYKISLPGCLFTLLLHTPLQSKPDLPTGTVYDAKNEIWILNEKTHQIVWYKDKKMRSEGALSASKKDGAWRFYFPNGKLKGEGSYRDDRKNGPWRFHYESGGLKASGEYLQDTLNGRWEFYYPNGKREMEGSFLNGFKEGEWTNYYDNGQIFYKGGYKKGLSDGPWVYYFDNGKLYQSGDYRADVRTGKWTICVSPGSGCQAHYFSGGGRAPVQSGISDPAALPAGRDPKSILDSLENGGVPDRVPPSVDGQWE